MKVFALLAFLAQANLYDDCDGHVNEKPVLDLLPVKIHEVPHGQAWKMEEDTNVVYIVKLQGTPYEMGYAYGQMLGPEIQAEMQHMPEYALDFMTPWLKEHFGFPAWLSVLTVEKVLLPFVYWLCDVNWNMALPYIPQRYIDEMQGIVDGSGGVVDQDLHRRVNMLPELMEATCSILGAWGEATADGQLYHLRALDWDEHVKVSQYPAVVIYEPSEEGSTTFANIGFMGLIGTLTAMNKNGISVGEKEYKDLLKEGAERTYYGQPWMFVLRDTIQFSKNLDDVERMLGEANRTMMVHLGWGSAPDNRFEGCDYAANFVRFYTDQEWISDFNEDHPQMNGVFYYNLFDQPNYSDLCMTDILTAHYGQITPELMYRNIVGMDRTGDTQVVVMDPKNEQIWASWSGYLTEECAFERSPIHIRLSEFWGETTPLQ